MSSHILVTCPGCQRPGMRVRAAWVGRKVRCQYCQHDFRVPEDLAALRAWLQEQELDLAESLRLRDEAARERDALRVELESLRPLAANVKVLEAARDAWASERQQLLGERDALLGVVAHADALQAERDALTHEGQTLRKATATLETERDALIEECQTLRARCGVLQDERRALEEEGQTWRDRWDALQKERDALGDENQIWRDRCKTLETERDAVSAERDEKVGERDALLKEHDAIRSQLSQSQDVAARMEALTGERDDLVQRLDSLSKLVQQGNEERAALSQQIASLEAEARAVPEITASPLLDRQDDAEAGTLRDQVASLEAEAKTLRKAVEMSTATLAALRGRFEQEKQARQEAETTREAVRAELEQSLDQVFALASQLAAARAELEKTRALTVHSSREEIDRLTWERDGWQNQAATLLNERDAARASAAMSAGAVRALETRVEELYNALQATRVSPAPKDAVPADPITLLEAAIQDISVAEVGRARVPSWKDPAIPPGVALSRADPGHLPARPTEREN